MNSFGKIIKWSGYIATIIGCALALFAFFQSKEAQLSAKVYPAHFYFPIEKMSNFFISHRFDYDYNDYVRDLIEQTIKKSSGNEKGVFSYSVLRKTTDQIVSYVVDRQKNAVTLLKELGYCSSLVLIELKNEGDVPAKNVKIYLKSANIFSEKTKKNIQMLESGIDTVKIAEIEQGKEIEILVWSRYGYAPDCFPNENIRISHDQGIAEIQIYHSVRPFLAFIDENWYLVITALILIPFWAVLIFTTFFATKKHNGDNSSGDGEVKEE